jgi:hypothetical protein
MSAIPHLSGLTKNGVSYGIRVGTGAPSSGLGFPGEIYVNKTNGEFYGPKHVDTGWGAPYGGGLGETGTAADATLLDGLDSTYFLNAGNLVGTLAAGRLPALIGDITTTVGSASTTLATVNSNVGSFGSATAAPTFTVNAKGLITAAGSVTITPAWSSITSTPTTLSGYGITDAVTASSYTAADVLSKLLTVDGTGSGLDADLLDGQSAAYYLSAANLTGTLAAARLPALTGDISSSTGSATLTLTTVNTNVGSFGSATAAPIFTVNAKGLITSAGSATITPAWNSITSKPTTLVGYGITDAQPISEKGQANGYAPLGADSKIATTYLPDVVLGALRYMGTWNANTNTPTIPAASSTNKGEYYIVATGGSTSISGITDWLSGDWLISNGTTWNKIDNTDAVISVAGLTGVITDSGLKTALNFVNGDITAALGFTPENAANKGATNGYASLASGLVPIAQLPVAANSVVRAGSSTTTVVSPSGLAAQDQPVTLTDGATVTIDMQSGVNWILTATSGIGNTRLLANPTNVITGRSGVVIYKQDVTGGRALTFGANWVFTVAPVINTAPNAVTVIFYSAETASIIRATQLDNPAFNDAGNLTGNLAAARLPALTGDITTSAGSAATTLATVNSNVGSFGSATAAPTFTVNAKGLITAAGTVTITPAWSSITSKPTTLSGYGITDSAGLGVANIFTEIQTITGVVPGIKFIENDQTAPIGGWTINLNSGSFYIRHNTANPVTFATQSIVMDISNAEIVNFANTPTVGGAGLWHANNDGPGSGLNADLLDNQNGTYYLDLTNVTGTLAAARLPALTGDITTTVGTVATTLATVNANTGSFGSATAASTFTVNAKGLITAAGSVTITPAWSSITSKPTTLSGYGITDAVSVSTYTAADVLAKLITVDGATSGLDADLLDGQDGPYYLAAANLTGTVAAARMPAFSGDASTVAGATAITLATVNSNVGSFGSATQTATFTVNAKGLITAASATTITPAWSSITSKPTTLTGYGITDALPLSGGTLTDALTISTSGRAVLNLTAPAGQHRAIEWQTSGTRRWNMTVDAGAESGSSAGSTFNLLAYNDAGTQTFNTMSISRATGQVTFAVVPFVGVNTMWHAGNDGTGSTLDADLLDGQHGAYYLDLTNATGTLSTARLPALSGDITTSAGSGATTLATVNSNVGSFGSATAAPTFTVNAKGQITAAGTVTITPSFASITGKPTTLAGYNISDAQLSSEKGQANGYAPLGGDAKISTAYLPDTVLGAMRYQGTWNATTDSPTIPAAATGNKGNYYVVSTAGSTAKDGITDWKIGDWIVSNGTVWEKIDNTDQVVSVAGLQGAISAGSLKTALSIGISDVSSLTTELGLRIQTINGLAPDGAGNVDVGLGTPFTKTFTADGIVSVFDLDATGTTADLIIVTVNGIVQRPTTDYTVSGENLTMVTTPLNGDVVSARLLGNYALIEDVLLSSFHSGKPTTSQVVDGQIAPYTFTFSAANSSARSLVAATASTVFVIKKNNSQVGTITFSAAGTTGTVAYSSTSVAAGDLITIHAPVSVDSTLADIAFLLRD